MDRPGTVCPREQCLGNNTPGTMPPWWGALRAVNNYGVVASGMYERLFIARIIPCCRPNLQPPTMIQRAAAFAEAQTGA